MKLVDKVKEACARRGVTVTEVEKAAGLPDNAIYKWDKHSPSIDRVKRVADVLQVTVDQLIERR